MTEKFKKLIKDNSIVLITFLSALIIINVIYILQQVTPYGVKSLLQVDFFHQYAPMLGELFDRVKGGESLLYSFYSGMGLPFFRNFFNYLSSPFNIFMFLFKRNSLLASFSFIIGLKAVVSATSMSFYLSKKFGKNKRFIAISLLYGFCAYFTAYYWNIMWLDGMLFLPLIVLGIERIINTEKYLLYILSLSLMLVTNYFIAYMICIFSVLYFAAYYILKSKKIVFKNILKNTAKFALASLLAGGLAAFALIPMFLGMKSISATSDLWPSSQYYSFTLLEFLANHFSGVGRTVLASGVSNAPNISVGILGIFLFILFYLNGKISLKKKIIYSSLWFVIVLAFLVPQLDFIWHAFHVPNDLPYRYSFIYSFVFIIIAAYSLYNIKHIKFRYVNIVFVFLMISISLLYIFKYKNISDSMILLNILLLILYYILFLMYKFIPNFRNKIPYLMICLVIVEAIIAINHNWNNDQEIDRYYDGYSETKEMLEYVHKNENGTPYRIEKTSTVTLNDQSWYGYYGQGLFTSMAYEDLAILQNNLGLPGNNINSYYYKQTTPVYDLIFNIKYFIGNTIDINRYELFYNEDGILTFKSLFESNLVYAVDNEIINWNYNYTDPLYIQNDFIYKSTGINNVFEHLSFEEKELMHSDENKQIYKYTFNNPGDNMYFYIDNHIDYIIIDNELYYNKEDNDHYNNIDKYIENIYVYNLNNFKENYIITSRTDNDQYEIYIGYNNHSYDDFHAYYINGEKFNEAVEILNNDVFNISFFKESKIKGNITLTEDKTIFTSIPYDKGWKVYANGERIPTTSIADSLLAFELEPGTYQLTFNFFPYGMKMGLIISISSLAVIFFLKKKKIYD